MEKQVIYRDRQELQAADLNNTQMWADEAQRHLVADAITPERQFVGLTVTGRSATEIEVSPGRLYDGPSGKVYAIESAQVHSVFAMLPLQDQKWLAVSAFGQEEDTDIEPRDFLIDLQTRAVEPEAVAMRRRRVAVVHIAQGLESPTPERPEPPTGYTLLAHARLSPTGIQEVVLADSRKLPNLFAVQQRLQHAEGWITSAEPRIAHIMSDIAGLGEQMGTRATIGQAMQLAMDMARVKERLEIPDNYKFYGADHFLSADESDTTAAGYSATVEEGLRPPVVATDTTSLALQNPIDPAARVSAGGLLLPAYEEIARLRLETRAGEITINQYQYNTTSMVQRTMSRSRIVYGETRSYCTNSSFWQSGQYDPATGIFRRDGETWTVDPQTRADALINHRFIRVTKFWLTSYTQTYWGAVPVPHTVQGSTLAQTLLMAQTGWITSVEFYVTHADAAGGLTVLFAECDGSGQPDTARVIARADLAASAMQGGWLRVPFTDPALVESGKRYAVILATGASHRVGYTRGTEYTQGILMYRQDGQWLSEGSADRDLMLRLNFARFTTPRAIIQLQPLQLAGGIRDIGINYDGATPPGTRLTFEYQSASGVWLPISDEREPAFGGMALLPLRAVFTGTLDLMPAARLAQSEVRVQRFGSAFHHTSTARTLASPSSDIRVRLLLEDFNPPDGHTVDCQIIIGGSPLAAASTRDEIVNSRSRWREYRFSPSTAASGYQIQITGGGVTATAPWHVAERYDLAL